MMNKFNEEKENELLEILKKGIDVYADYRDEVNINLLKRISDKKEEMHSTWMEAFKDELFDWFDPDDIFETMKSHMKDIAAQIGLDYDDFEEEDKAKFDTVFFENVWFKPDYDHYLKQKLCVDIFVDTGDYNFDLGCNEVYPHYNGDRMEPIQDECCLVWLTKTQGYTKEDLEKNLLSDEVFDNEIFDNDFFESIYDELNNCTSHMNSLVFLKRLTLKEYLDMKDANTIHIDKDDVCGLFDKWNGAGGLLEIKLEKDIDIPKEMVHEAVVDEMFKYNIHDVYGVNDSFWE